MVSGTYDKGSVSVSLLLLSFLLACAVYMSVSSSVKNENQEEAPFWAELSDEVSPLPRPALAGHRGLAAAETITTSIFLGD